MVNGCRIEMAIRPDMCTWSKYYIVLSLMEVIEKYLAADQIIEYAKLNLGTTYCRKITSKCPADGNRIPFI